MGHHASCILTAAINNSCSHKGYDRGSTIGASYFSGLCASRVSNYPLYWPLIRFFSHDGTGMAFFVTLAFSSEVEGCSCWGPAPSGENARPPPPPLAGPSQESIFTLTYSLRREYICHRFSRWYGFSFSRMWFDAVLLNRSALCQVARGETQSIPTGRPSGYVRGDTRFRSSKREKSSFHYSTRIEDENWGGRHESLRLLTTPNINIHPII